MTEAERLSKENGIPDPPAPAEEKTEEKKESDPSADEMTSETLGNPFASETSGNDQLTGEQLACLELLFDDVGITSEQKAEILAKRNCQNVMGLTYAQAREIYLF